MSHRHSTFRTVHSGGFNTTYNVQRIIWFMKYRYLIFYRWARKPTPTGLWSLNSPPNYTQTAGDKPWDEGHREPPVTKADRKAEYGHTRRGTTIRHTHPLAISKLLMSFLIFHISTLRSEVVSSPLVVIVDSWEKKTARYGRLQIERNTPATYLHNRSTDIVGAM